MRTRDALLVFIIFSFRGSSLSTHIRHMDGTTIVINESVEQLMEESNEENTVQSTEDNRPIFHLQSFLPTSRKLTKRKATRQERFRWTYSTIPYEFTNRDFNATEMERIKAAMNTWSSKTCLTFRPARSTDVNKIKFYNGIGCNSMVGMVGGTQLVSLESPGCRTNGMYLHELGHAIGLVHEHQLPERDEYIVINVDNIQPYMKDWYQKYSQEEINNYGVPYEYSSIMHYGLSDFARDKHIQTIFVNDRTREHEIGEVWEKSLSFTDVKVVNLMYKCNKHCSANPRCKEPGYLDRSCRCICPPKTDCTKEDQGQRIGGGWGISSDCKNRWNDSDCTSWSRRGECENNPLWMKENCRKACDKCAKNCSNIWPDSDCNKWTDQGECSRNKDWMEKNCKESCRGCNQGFNVTRPNANITIVSESFGMTMNGNVTEDEGNYTFQNGTDGQTSDFSNSTSDISNSTSDISNSTDIEKGAFTANASTSSKINSPTTTLIPCRNFWKDDDCEVWSKRGDCHTNPSWMRKYCARSCMSC